MAAVHSEIPPESGSSPVESFTEVRYGETDQMGYAHHATAVLWFELGRVRWLRHHGLSYRALEESGFLLPVVDMHICYHAPGRFEDALAIETRLAGTGRCRVNFDTRVLRVETDKNRTLLLSGEVQLACVDREERRPTRLPPALRALAERLHNNPSRTSAHGFR